MSMRVDEEAGIGGFSLDKEGGGGNPGDINRMRAEIRNSLRSLVEKIPVLAGIFGKPYLRAVGPKEIEEEENEIGRFRAKTSSGVAQVIESSTVVRSREEIAAEENVKYMAAKLAYLLSREKYAEARRLAGEEYEKYKGESTGNYRQAVFLMRTTEQFREFLLKGPLEELGERYLRLQSVSGMGGRHLQHYCPEFTDDRDMQVEAFKRVKESALRIHPELYFVLMAGLRLPAGKNENEFIKDVVKSQLKESLKSHFSVFVRDRDCYRKSGYYDQSLDHDPDIKKMILNKMVKYMARDPGLYFFARDKWKVCRLFDPAKMDNEEKIRKALSVHLYRWSRISRSMYGKMRFNWAKQGVVECDLTDEEKKAVDRESEMEIRTGSLLWQMSLDTSLERAGEFVDICLRGYEREFNEMVLREQKREQRLAVRLKEIRKGLAVFKEKYPQFEEVCLELIHELELERNNAA